ncbi:uncharacterized protein TrAtP1_012387 [Trichoderma atroviride]|uniref:uncharacterized protein n=1 Tax=Hypocrea atroviridis TaxID=63577 RepID=UPI00333195DB|nr:hypothetical protein TrAtP1_012387 [Trichoderma atroviride]
MLKQMAACKNVISSVNHLQYLRSKILRHTLIDDRPEHSRSFRKRTLYKALSDSYDDEMDLEFYIPDDYNDAEHTDIRFHVPVRLNGARRYGKSVPSQDDSLWSLIERGYFAKQPGIDLWIDDDSSTIINTNQRKTLAISLVLGLMLSIDCSHNLDVWDPKNIHFLKPIDKDYTPFISIHGNNSASVRNRLSIAGLHSRYTIDEDEENLRPMPQFMLLAKALMQIAWGDCLRSIKVPEGSQSAFMDPWKELRGGVSSYYQKMKCDSEGSRESLPFLEAALGCLNFHKDYQVRLRGAMPSQEIEIAWQVIFDKILLKIDANLVSKGLSKSSSDSATSNNSLAIITEGATKMSLSVPYVSDQTHVKLFDTKQTSNPSAANEFWQLLERFHSSSSRYISEHSTLSEVDLPRRIRIAVLDTGIDFHHSAILEAKEKGRMSPEWCYSWVGDKSNAQDDDNDLHGTNCAYLLHKVAPEADIYIGKVFERNTVRLYEAENIAKAIEYATNVWDVDIISMSFGLMRPKARGDGNKDEERLAMERFNQIVDDIEIAIRNSANLSRIFFAAASNSGKNEPRAFPASYQPWVICVHASEGNGEDGGINPELGNGFNLMTLGMGIELMERECVIKNGKTTIHKYKTVIKSGTSFATPVAAGIAAIVLDLAARVKEINSRAKRKIKRHEEMEKILRLMSTAKGKEDVRGRLHYMAPWLHWENGWEIDETKCRLVWDTINNTLL